MELAEELQLEAAERAGSLEGFMQVIRLVIDDVEGREILSPPVVTFVDVPIVETAFSRASVLPYSYLPIFREYVSLRQEEIGIRRHISSMEGYPRPGSNGIKDNGEYAAAQKHLSDTIHAANRKRRELPIHAYKRLIQIETRFNRGCNDMYQPIRWEPIAEDVEKLISRWGEGRLPSGHYQPIEA
jgi:hypothetical protein